MEGELAPVVPGFSSTSPEIIRSILKCLLTELVNVKVFPATACLSEVCRQYLEKYCSAILTLYCIW